jgi:hypothetical protein
MCRIYSEHIRHPFWNDASHMNLRDAWFSNYPAYFGQPENAERYMLSGVCLCVSFVHNSFHRITHLEMTHDHFWKAKPLEKDHRSKKNQGKYHKNARWPEGVRKIVCLKVTVKITNEHIKVVFGNSLMQKHWYYPTTSIWCIKNETLRKASWAYVLMLPISRKITWIKEKT